MAGKYSRSLKELEELELAEYSSLKHSESRHEFYMSMWKAGPYVLVPLISTTIYAFFLYGDIGYLLLLVFVAISILASFSWLTAGRLDDEIATQRIKANLSSKDVGRRKAKVEALFASHTTSSGYLYIQSVRFDDSLRGGSLGTNYIPPLLEDMKHLNNDLVALMSSFDETINEYRRTLVEFFEGAKKEILILDSSIGSGPSAPDHMAQRIKGLYYILSGSAISADDILQPELHGISNPEAAFMRLVWAKHDKSNPFPALLGKEYLRGLARLAEDARVKALSIETTISYLKAVLYEEPPGFRPGL